MSPCLDLEEIQISPSSRRSVDHHLKGSGAVSMRTAIFGKYKFPKLHIGSKKAVPQTLSSTPPYSSSLFFFLSLLPSPFSFLILSLEREKGRWVFN